MNDSPAKCRVSWCEAPACCEEDVNDCGIWPKPEPKTPWIVCYDHAREVLDGLRFGFN